MNMLWSPSTGALLVPDANGGETEIRYLGEALNDHVESVSHVLPLVKDWQQVEREIDNNLLVALEKEHWTCQAASYLRYLLRGMPPDIELTLLLEVEELLKTRIDPSTLLAEMLVAPLSSPEYVAALVGIALADGLGAVASLLESLRELQPQLRRLSAAWMSIPDSAFVEISCTRQRLWRNLSTSGAILNLLESDSPTSFSAMFLPVLKGMQTQDRKNAAAVLRRLSEVIFPNTDGTTSKQHGDRRQKDELPAADGPSKSHRHTTVHERFTSVLKQIDSIVSAVAQGKDANANRFLRQLLTEQHDNPKHAVKSLCNIAQRCKEMFRADFEKRCLSEAVNLGQHDSRLLTQYGDHLKRCGRYDEAMEVLQRAANIGDGADVVVALSSLASVWTQQGQYDRAEATLRRVHDWEHELSVQTALADIERYKSNYAEAERQYKSILAESPGYDRALAGIAEIAKQRGHLSFSVGVYDDLIAQGEGDERSLRIWRLSLCHILKLQGKLEHALKVVDDVVQISPFLIQARAQRSAILGLMGREAEGLGNLPQPHGPTAFGQWLQQYVRGLLLHKLERFSEARSQLVDRFTETIISGEGETLLRLGAALSFLADDCIEDAEGYLESIREKTNLYEGYLVSVLRLHLAVAKADRKRVDSVLEDLQEIRQKEPLIDAAVRALQQGKLDDAGRLEVALLLRVA